MAAPLRHSTATPCSLTSRVTTSVSLVLPRASFQTICAGTARLRRSDVRLSLRGCCPPCTSRRRCSMDPPRKVAVPPYYNSGAALSISSRQLHNWLRVSELVLILGGGGESLKWILR